MATIKNTDKETVEVTDQTVGESPNYFQSWKEIEKSQKKKITEPWRERAGLQ